MIMFVTKKKLEHLADEGGQRQRDDDRDARQHQRQQGGHERAEHDQQDDQRDRDADRLALLEIASRRPSGSRGRSTPGRRTAAVADCFVGGGLRGGDDVADLLVRLHAVALQDDLHERAAVGRRADLGRADAAGSFVTAAIDRGLRGRRGRLDHDDLDDPVGGALALLDAGGGLLRLGVRHEALLRGERAGEQRRDDRERHDQRHGPGGDDAPGWAAERRAQRAGERMVVMVGTPEYRLVGRFCGEIRGSALEADRAERVVDVDVHVPGEIVAAEV